ncbi:MAG: penicillin-binding transpeptidase domain-containing protein [Patescibacteria group bacterium]
MPDFFVEESVLDDLAKGLDLMETPLSERVFKIFGFFAFFIIAIATVELFFLGILNGNFYKNKALANAGKIISIPAERGIIFDRNGKTLVKNFPIYKIELKLVELFKNNELNGASLMLKDILKMDYGELNNLVKSVNLEKQDSIILALDLGEEEIEKIKKYNLKSVQIKKDFKREYQDAVPLSHIIGYIGKVDKNFIKENPSFSLNDEVGKSGLENYYDKELRGADGKIIYYRNAKGEIIDDKFLKDALAGQNIKTTIDGDLQVYFFNRIKSKLDEIGSRAGAGIIMNLRTGEILSLVSIPGFDSNKITSDVLKDFSKPLFNRVISGLYSPGSTIKPLVAFAALKEGLVSPKTEIFSRGYIEIPNPYNPDNPSRFVDWKPHGWVDIYSALAKSSNIYFYALGGGLPKNETEIVKIASSGDKERLFRGLGIEKLKEYWEQFGLDRKTGIDLPSETEGFLPDPETKILRKKENWRLGDTYNTSIGQGDLIITPIELISYISAIANNGKFYQPFIAKKFIAGTENIIREIEPKLIKDFSDYSDYFKEVQEGMIDAVEKPYGTAHLLSGLPMKIAGKTGSAQINNNTKVNAFFVGYTISDPLRQSSIKAIKNNDNSEIAILVLIENAREGSLNAVPVAKDVLEWYYYNKIK